MVDISSFKKMFNNRSFNLQDAFIILLFSFFSGSILFFLSIPYMKININVDGNHYKDLFLNISTLQTCINYYVDEEIIDNNGKRSLIYTKINDCRDTFQITDEDDDNNLLSIKKYSETLFGLYIAISVLTIIFVITYLYGNKKIYNIIAILLLLLIISTFVTLISFVNVAYITYKNQNYNLEFTPGSIITLVMLGIMILLLSYILYK
jgi:amino acid transporter